MWKYARKLSHNEKSSLQNVVFIPHRFHVISVPCLIPVKADEEIEKAVAKVKIKEFSLCHKFSLFGCCELRKKNNFIQ